MFVQQVYISKSGISGQEDCFWLATGSGTNLVGKKTACIFFAFSEEDLLGTHHLLSNCFLLSPHLAWPNINGAGEHVVLVDRLRKKKILSHGKRFEGNQSRKVLLSIGRRRSGLASVR